MDATRGVATLLVVLFHATVMYGGGSAAQLVATATAPFRMPALLLISGFVSRSVVRDPRRARRRALDQLWLVLMWTPLVAHSKTVPVILAEILLPRSPLWFLWASGLILAVAAVVPVARRGQALVLFAVAAAASAVLARSSSLAGSPGSATMFVADPTAPLCIVQAARYLVFFLIGILADRWIALELARVGGRRLLGWGGATAAAGAAVAIGGAFALPLGLAASVTVLQFCCLTSHHAVTRALASLGRVTLPIYLCHYSILHACHRLVGDVTASWQVVALAALAVGASLGVYRLAHAIHADWLFRRPALRSVPWPTLLPARA